MCNAYLLHIRTCAAGYFNRQSLAINFKASVSRPRFTWQFVFHSKPTSCLQFVKVFPLPPSLWRWVRYIALPSLKSGHSCVVRLSLRSDFPQACWLVCLCTLLANQYSCLIQHVLFTTQLVVLCHAIQNSHRLTSRKAVFPPKNANTSVVSFYCASCYVFKS